MCFNTTSKVRIAKTNILCFKVLRKTRSGRLYSPIMDKYKWDLKQKVVKDFENYHTVEGQIHGIHTFRTFKDARNMSNHRNSFNSFYTYRMMIPKGALYYQNGTQYLSNKIILKSLKPIK
jgi:hypothetical protein